MSWDGFGYLVTEEQPSRFAFQPFGDLDFLELPAPIMSVGAGPWGITFQCADHGLYYLTGEPGDVNSWIVRMVSL